MMNEISNDKPQSSSTPTVDFKLHAREVVLIKRLREVKFGILEVHVIDGVLVRTILKQNELLKDEV
jgi:hypothetical protein